MAPMSPLSLLIVAALAAPVQAQDWARKMFEVTSHDFGTIARGAKAEYEFVFTNLYEDDIHIARVRSSCGCTTPRVEKDTLKTYEQTAVIASINSQSFLGHQSATITVTIDRPFYAEVQLHVKVYVRTDVVLDPASVTLGDVDEGAEVEKTARVTHLGRGDWQIVVRGKKPFRITSVSADCQCLQVSVPKETDSQALHLLPVTFAAGKEPGRVSATIRIEADKKAAGQVSACAAVVGKG